MRTDIPECGVVVITTGDKRQGFTTRVWTVGPTNIIQRMVFEHWVRGGKSMHRAVVRRVQAGEFSRPSVAA